MSFIAVIAGARPNFMKVAPLLKAFSRYGVPAKLIHTGQHYDQNMSDVFFTDLGMDTPDVHLGAASGSHAQQTADIMVKFEKYCLEEKPAWILVVGDVNSTVACSLVAAKLGIKVCHLEAGLRSRDWSMPEEINRVVTDRLSDLLLTPSLDGNENLQQEGVPAERIHYVGNIMIDSVLQNLDRAANSSVYKDFGLQKGAYILCTLHRPSNVDTKSALEPLLRVLIELSRIQPVVFPVHPRTEKSLTQFGLAELLVNEHGLKIIPPQGYINFLALSSGANFVITDSGGLQEESTALGIPCLTVRENTERPITITEGTNQLVGTDPDAILRAARKILDGERPAVRCPELWDGKAAERSAQIFRDLF